MKYFLDFDRTLFDTDALIAYMAERADTKDIYSLPEDEIKKELGRRAEDGRLMFAPGELARFVYPDSEDFLNRHLDAIVVTHGNAALQRLKVENVFSHLATKVFYTTEEFRKGQYLKEKLSAPRDGVFVDDRPVELESVTEYCPTFRVFEMRRDGKEGSGKYPVVHDLAELEAAVLK
jgi:hypothetical protein